MGNQPKARPQQPMQAVATAQPIPVVHATLVQPQTSAIHVHQPSPQDALVQSISDKVKVRWPELIQPVIDDANAQKAKEQGLKAAVDRVDADIKELVASGQSDFKKETELKKKECE